MTLDQFEWEMNRLVTRYGNKVFSPELTKQIYSECHDLSHGWFKTLVTNLEGEQRLPKLSDMRESIKLEREKKWRDEKSLPRLDELQSQINSIFPRSDVNEMIKVCKARLSLRITKKDCDQYLRLVEETLEERRKVKTFCRTCEEGIVTAYLKNDRYVFRCSCPIGKQRKETWSEWSPNFYNIGFSLKPTIEVIEYVENSDLEESEGPDCA